MKNFYSEILEGFKYDNLHGKIIDKKNEKEELIDKTIITNWLKIKNVKSYSIEIVNDKYSISFEGTKNIEISAPDMRVIPHIAFNDIGNVTFENIDIEKYKEIIPIRCFGITFSNCKVNRALSRLKKIDYLIFDENKVNLDYINSKTLNNIISFSFFGDCEIEGINKSKLNQTKIELLLDNNNLKETGILSFFPNNLSSLTLNYCIVEDFNNFPKVKSLYFDTMATMSSSVMSLDGIDIDKVGEIGYVSALELALITPNNDFEITQEIVLTLSNINVKNIIDFNEKIKDKNMDIIIDFMLFLNGDTQKVAIFYKEKNKINEIILNYLENNQMFDYYY